MAAAANTGANTLVESKTRSKTGTPHANTTAPHSRKRKSRGPTVPYAVWVGKKQRRSGFEDTEADTDTAASAADCGPAGNKSSTSQCTITRGHAPFISILHDIVQNESGPLVGWADQGQSLVIKLPEQFAKKHCDHQKFACFARQMNSYGYEHMSRR